MKVEPARRDLIFMQEIGGIPEWHLLKRIITIFVTLLGYATLTQPTNREYCLYPVGRISVA